MHYIANNANSIAPNEVLKDEMYRYRSHSLIFFALFSLFIFGCGKSLERGTPGGSGGSGGSNELLATTTVQAVTGGSPLAYNAGNAILFSQPRGDLDGKSANDVLDAAFPGVDGQRLILSSGVWRMMNQVPAGQYSGYQFNFPSSTVTNNPNCLAQLSGNIPSNGSLEACLNVASDTAAYTARVNLVLVRPNSQITQRTLLLVVVPDLTKFQSSPTCSVSLSTNTLTMDQPLTGTVTVHGFASAIRINGVTTSLPFRAKAIPLRKDAQGLGLQNFVVEVIQPNSSGAAATCSTSYNVNPASKTAQRCESVNSAYQECTFPGVKEILNVGSFVQISATDCSPTRYGITADKKRLFTDNGCRADFDFTYIPE